jgi:hypothetical protein
MNALPDCGLSASLRRIDEAADADLARLERARKPTAGQAEPLLRVVEVGDLRNASVTPPRFVVDPVIPRRVITLLSAPGGTGKSTLALTLCACVAAGRPFGPFAVEQGRALFVSLEDEADYARYQLANIVEAFDLDRDAVAKNLHIADGATDDVSLAHEYGEYGVRALIADAALAQLGELAKDVTLIAIDGVGDAMRANVNDPGIVRDFIRRKLGRIARDANCGILLLGHVDKAGSRNGTAGQTYLGSTEFNNSPRSRLALTEIDGTLHLVHEKRNRSRMAEPLPLRWSESHAGVLTPANAGGGSVDHALALIETADAEGLLIAMRAAAAAGVNIPTGRTGPSTAQKTLETISELPQGLRGTKGRARFWHALNRLQCDGRVNSETYANEHRHRRTRLVAI